MKSNLLVFCSARHLLGCVLLWCMLGLMPSVNVWAADDSTASASAQGAVQGAANAVKDAGESVAQGIELLWQRIDENRLKNRTVDELVAWVIMGVLVGAVAGLLSAPKGTVPGKLGRLLMGLVGAFVGGMVARVTQVDMGLGPVLIRYEELLFSLVGALVIVVLGRLILPRVRSGKSDKG